MEQLLYTEKDVAGEIADRLTKVKGIKFDAVKAPIGWEVKPTNPNLVLLKAKSEVVQPQTPVETITLLFRFISDHPKSLVVQNKITGKPRWLSKADIVSYKLMEMALEPMCVQIEITEEMAKKRDLLAIALSG